MPHLKRIGVLALYWNAADLRPWGTYLDESDKRYERYRRTQGR